MVNATSKMEYVAGYKGLNVWIKADELAVQIYKITKEFPKDEVFGLISQMKRAAVSVPANIAEGYGRQTKKDKTHFYYIARGSLNEIEYFIDLSLKLGYITIDRHAELVQLRNDIGRLLSGLIKSSVKPLPILH